ncbi:Putative membrane-associated protein/domain [Thermococcus nautili]|uniref:helix-turn-helix transcriptional regulator n=1 Tax=Thermococcus nautili TaxID=195522 RepID=UPI002555F100|nr:MarR family transcriptional regulator [Thermococcus nautili]CAI1493801.1 Putative membrane-associated protein/domain [Thermococcus nautili]
MKKALAVVLLLLTLPVVLSQATVESVSVEVYGSGYVKVTEVVVPSNYSVAVEIPLLSEDITGLAVLDENGNPLLFEKNGSVLTVYVLNSTTKITVTYFTASLTSKEGEVWNLTYSFPYPVTIKLPPGAVVVDLSDVPLKITSDTITMPPGNQSVSYILPLPTTTTSPPSTTTTSTTTTSISNTQSTTSSTVSTASTSTSPATIPENTSPQEPGTSAASGGRDLFPILGILAVIGIPAVAYWAKKRGNPGNLPLSREEFKEKLEAMGLTDEEINALLYVYDQGGRAKQADVRKALGIPKTTAWRMFKRLEEKGLVRVYKRGKENWVELVF